VGCFTAVKPLGTLLANSAKRWVNADLVDDICVSAGHALRANAFPMAKPGVVDSPKLNLARFTIIAASLLRSPA
jgi:hypothetical protein